MAVQVKKADSKGRIMLPEMANTHVIIKQISDNEFLITKAAVVPESTAWFFKNTKAQELVALGLKEAAAGELIDFDPFAEDL